MVSAQGHVELYAPHGWMPVSSGAILCHGDLLRTGPFSRATIWLPEKDEAHGTTFRLQAHTQIKLSAYENETHSWYDVIVNLVEGWLMGISRHPLSLGFDTPFANAGIEGTEFVLAVEEEGTTLTVIEGEVRLSNSSGTATVPAGQRGFAALGTTPHAVAVQDALASIERTRAFPRLLNRELPDPDAAPNQAEGRSGAFYSGRAASRLAAGAVEAASTDLETALSIDPQHADALALQAIIAASNGDFDRAVALAEQAVEAEAASPAGWLALSYIAVRIGDSRRALESAEMAASVAPDNLYAWARVAELRFDAGNFRGARAAAERAAEINADAARVRAVLGFVALGDGHSTAAENEFREAIRLDGSDALARLGLALTLTRQGNPNAARRDAEAGLAHDPTNAVFRSYLAKLYDRENRSELSAVQLNIGKALDDHDATASFYDALRLQHSNRLGPALLNYRRAYAQNGRRAVYGPGLAMDENLPARSAGIGRLHSALGFEQLALLAGWRATLDEPAEYSGHRLIADLYANRPRHQIARVNEVHQSIMHQPLNITPMQPQLTEANPFALRVVGPSALSFLEYNGLLRENGLSYQLSGTAADNGTRGLDFTVNGLHDRVSYNIGYLDFETDGFRPNNDFAQQLLDAIVQIRPDAATTITTEIRISDIDKGDLPLRFDPNAFSSLRQGESVDSFRTGVRRRTLNGIWIGTASAERIDAEFNVGNFLQSSSRRGGALDLQYITQAGRWRLTSGARYLRQKQIDELFTAPPAPGLPPGEGGGSQHSVHHKNIYLYGNLDLSASLRATVGGSFEEVLGYDESRQHFAPKLGVMWDASGNTTLRAALFRTLQPPFVSRHNVIPTLEPTHLVGFNQQFVGVQGERAWSYGVGIDHEFTETLFGGVELFKRDVEMPSIAIDPETSGSLHSIVDRDELLYHAYLYWLPNETVSFTAGYEYLDSDAGESRLPDGYTRLSTHRLPFAVRYWHPSGFSAEVETSYVSQTGYFSPFVIEGVEPERGSDRFLTTNVALSYRLPSKRGHVALNIHNAFDRDFRFQDLDPENPRLFPGRIAQLSFTLSY